MKYYALQTKNGFQFYNASKTPEELEEKILRAYWNWRGCQKAGSEPTIGEYMARYQKVEVTVHDI